jgi:hypothetical protein
MPGTLYQVRGYKIAFSAFFRENEYFQIFYEKRRFVYTKNIHTYLFSIPRYINKCLSVQENTL